MGRVVKNDLGLLDTCVKRFPQAGVDGQSRYVPAEERIKKMHYTMITKEFCDTMNEINLIQTNYQVMANDDDDDDNDSCHVMEES